MKMILHVNVKPTKEDEHMTKIFLEAVKWEIKKIL